MMALDSLFKLFLFLIVIFSRIGVESRNISAENDPPCTTPYKTNGQCVRIERCRNIHRIVSSPNSPITGIAKYIKQAVCTLPNVRRSVCCQPEEVVKEQVPGNITVESVTSCTTPGQQCVPEQTLVVTPNLPNLNLLPEDCGLTANDRIAYGTATEAFQYPWMAVLMYNKGTHIIDDKCGGTLINKRYVLSAAHCIEPEPTVKLIGVRLGEHTKKQDEDCIISWNDEGTEIERECAPPPEDYEIESYVVHSDFEGPHYGNDIGLLRLKKEVTMNDHIQPICLPVTQELRTKKLDKFIVTGWGLTEKGTKSDVLMQANLPLVDNVECQRIYGQSKSRIAINEMQICAGGQNRVDSCKGDSGGPLGCIVEYFGLVRFVQFGVVSFGVDSCGFRSIPGVYTRVSNYMDWILDNIKP